MKIKNLRVEYRDIREMSKDVYNILNPENTYDITLVSNTTVTTVTNQFVGLSSVIAMMATSADAAAEPYYITTTADSFNITHSSGASTRTFRYFVYG